MARAPREVQNQLAELLEGSARQTPTTVEDPRRAKWIEKHLTVSWWDRRAK